MKPGDRQPKRLGCSRLELKAVSTSGSITSFWDMADVQHSVFKSWCKFYEVVKWRTQHGWTQTTVMQLGVQWNWILHSIIAARESSEALFEGALWSSSFVSDNEAGVVFYMWINYIQQGNLQQLFLWSYVAIISTNVKLPSWKKTVLQTLTRLVFMLDSIWSSNKNLRKRNA